jgi:hypothetical protein
MSFNFERVLLATHFMHTPFLHARIQLNDLFVESRYTSYCTYIFGGHLKGDIDCKIKDRKN